MNAGPSIRYIDQARAWLIETGGTSYAFAVDAKGFHLKHLYWGASIEVDDVSDLAAEQRDWWLNTPDTRVMRQPGAAWRGFESTPRAFMEEIVAQGGFRYDEATVAIQSPTTTGLLFCYRKHVISELGEQLELCVTLADDQAAVELDLHYRVSHSAPGIERWITLRNIGSHPLVIDRLCSASWPLPAGRTFRARNFFGHVQGEFQLENSLVTHGRRSLGTRTGTSGHRGTPWIALHDDASETGGDVWSVALAYSGSWQITTQASDDNGVHIVSGIADEEMRQVLDAGEKVTTPISIGVYSNEGFTRLSHQWHKYVNSHVPTLVRPLPVMYNSWFSLQFAMDKASLLEQARLAAGLGVELFVIDDGWFEGRDDDFHGLGRWTPDSAKFPDGLAPLQSALAELGMEFGIWVEPEMCTPDSRVYQEHPEWIRGEPGRFWQTHRNQFVIDLAIPEARAWVVEHVSRAVSESRCSYVVWDMNRPIPLGRKRTGESPTHAEGLAQVLNELRERHPGVVWQACSGGGGRADLGILSSMSLTWPSDDTDAHDRARIVQAASQVLPPSVLVHWLTDLPARNSTSDRLQQTESLATRFHTAMNGVLGVSADLTRWTAAELAQATELIEKYKATRAIIANGSVYRLEVSAESLGLAYVDSGANEAVIFVVAQRFAYGENVLRIRLRGLDENARYSVDGALTRSGRILMQEGLVLDGSATTSWALHLRRL
ncbi:alpha-galactosidase [Arthrobacter sp. H5]|uniref:alpha-galactosidase n=1 Tax=Arthrobacter sp. H5 TaxID=1267973 RepID=UPI00047FD130|nr:alpha-galactosidase [Arthrobacter sp. H5]